MLHILLACTRVQANLFTCAFLSLALKGFLNGGEKRLLIITMETAQQSSAAERVGINVSV